MGDVGTVSCMECRHTLHVVFYLTHALFISAGIKLALLQHVHAEAFRFHQ